MFPLTSSLHKRLPLSSSLYRRIRHHHMLRIPFISLPTTPPIPLRRCPNILYLPPPPTRVRIDPHRTSGRRSTQSIRNHVCHRSNSSFFPETLNPHSYRNLEGRRRGYFSGSHMGDRGLVDVDKLILRGLLFHGFHGVKQEEKTLGQKFLVDVDAWLDLSEAGKTDNISDTISYTDIYRIAKEVVEGPSQNLLESVAHLIAKTTLSKFPQISAIRVQVGKPHVAVQGPVNYLGVEIMRYRGL